MARRAKSSVAAILPVAAVCLVTTGCSSLQVRHTEQYQSDPHVYPATRDREELGFPKPIAEFIDDLEDPVKFDPWVGVPYEFHPESCLFGGIAWVIGGVFYVAVDKPIAIVSDTVLFPYDRRRVRQFNAVTRFWQHTFAHEGALPLPSCAELCEHNYPPYVDSALPEYLDREEVSRPLLVQLVRADVGSRFVAASSHVDIDLGNLLLSTSGDMTNVCVALSGNTSAPPAVLESVLQKHDSPAVLRNLAANPNATPRLFEDLFSYGEAHPRVFDELARNPNVPDRLLSRLTARCDGYVARNTSASLQTLEEIVRRSSSVLVMCAVIKHPATTDELLRSIVEKFPDDNNVEGAIVDRTEVPDDVVWTLARNGAANNALAGRPALPPDILSYLAENASWPVQRILASRTDLPLEAQRLLARGDSSDARRFLVLNPTVSSEVLHEMARSESDSLVLQTMAGLTNVSESTYLALTAKSDQRVLSRLACNSAVTDAVLQELLKNADERTAGIVLRSDRASFRTKRRALETIGTPRAYGKIESAVLDQNEVINGIAYMAGTRIRFRHSGGVSYGTLAADRILDGRDLDSILFRKGQPLRFDSTGTVSTRPPLPTVIQGIPCAVKAHADDSGRLRETVLAEEHTIGSITLPAGSDVEFFESGIVKECTSPLPINIQGIACASNAPILFHESGKLRRAYIAEECTINGVTLPGNQRVHLLESGALYYTDQARGHRRTAHRLWREGDVEQALRECERALALSPNYAGAFSLRGAIKRAEGTIAAALVDYEHAIDIDAGQAGAHSGAAICLHILKEWNRAIEHFTRAIEIDGRNPYTYLCRAETWQAKREFRRALNDYNRAHELHSDYTPAANNLAWFLATCPDAECRDGKRALGLAHDLVAKQRTAPHLDTLAAAYAELGKFRKAIKTQEEAIALAKKDDAEHLLPQFEERLARYRQREAWRE